MSFNVFKSLSCLTVSICAATLVVGCGKDHDAGHASDSPRASAAEITEIALTDVPADIVSLVQETSPDFEMKEVLRKLRDGRTYFDVEGELPSGDEIEFDVLMTDAGPQIVEIQRDIAWKEVPKKVRKITNKANSEKLDVVRIIESKQTDNSIIYEIFVEGQKSDPKFEVQVSDGQAKLLAERAIH